MNKAPIPDQILTDWFTKSLLPPIARHVAMGGAITEEQVIARAQYLDLVYSHSSTLYDLIPNAPRPSIDPSRLLGLRNSLCLSFINHIFYVFDRSTPVISYFLSPRGYILLFSYVFND